MTAATSTAATTIGRTGERFFADPTAAGASQAGIEATPGEVTARGAAAAATTLGDDAILGGGATAARSLGSTRGSTTVSASSMRLAPAGSSPQMRCI